MKIMEVKSGDPGYSHIIIAPYQSRTPASLILSCNTSYSRQQLYLSTGNEGGLPPLRPAPPPGRLRLFLPLYARLFIALVPADIAHYSCLLARLLKPAQRAVQRLILTYPNLAQTPSPLPCRRARLFLTCFHYTLLQLFPSTTTLASAPSLTSGKAAQGPAAEQVKVEVGHFLAPIRPTVGHQAKTVAGYPLLRCQPGSNSDQAAH